MLHEKSPPTEQIIDFKDFEIGIIFQNKFLNQ